MEIVTKIAPIILALIMLGLGLGLKIDDFTRIIKSPKDFIVGFISQLIILPIVAYILILILKTPPGAAAMIITPIAISGGVLKIRINMYAIIGRTINWEIKPTIKSFGVFNTLPKSSSFNPRPKPSIIKANMIGAIFVTISKSSPPPSRKNN